MDELIPESAGVLDHIEKRDGTSLRVAVPASFIPNGWLAVRSPEKVLRGWVKVKSVNEKSKTLECEGPLPAGTSAGDFLCIEPIPDFLTA